MASWRNISYIVLICVFFCSLSLVCGQNQEQKRIDNAGNSNAKSNAPSASPQSTTNLPKSTEVKPTTKINVITTDCTNNTSCNSTKSENDESGLWNKVKKSVRENKGMLLRTFYVLMGLTAIVIVYFVIRAWRIRRRSKSRKYGLITTRGSDLEMAPLDQDDDDDDDDMTVFELNNRRRK